MTHCLYFYPFPRLDVVALRDFIVLQVGDDIVIWDQGLGHYPDVVDSLMEVDMNPAAEISLDISMDPNSQEAHKLLRDIAIHFGCWLASSNLPIDSGCSLGGMWGIVSPEGDFLEAHDNDEQVDHTHFATSAETWLIDWSTLQPLGTCASRHVEMEDE